MTAVATVCMFAFAALVCGLLLAFVPYLTRRNECFAVTVPTAAQADSRLVSLKRRYAAIMVAVTVASTAVSTVAGLLIVWGTGQPGGALGGMADGAASGLGVSLVCAALLVPAIVSFALMLSSRKRVMNVKRAEGWAAGQRERTAVIGEEDVPGPVPLAWNLLYVAVVLLTAAIGLALYPAMPDMIPMHADFSGNVNSYVEKSAGTVFGFPLAMEAFMALVFFGCHAMIVHSKRPTDPGAPATSALAYGMFARAQSVFLLVTGVLVSGGIGVGFMLSSAGVVTLGQMGTALMVVCALVLVGAIALSLVYGQNGARLFRRMQGDNRLPDDDDERWKLGVFYVNPDDASVFLPKRFGIGWTLNFARPAAWATVLGLVALTAAFVAVVWLLG